MEGAIARPPVERDTLSEQVHAWLRDQILRGHIRQGEHLSELGISRDLGVSATPVREALRVLSGDGLIEFVGRRGARVIEPTDEQIRHCFGVRRALECLALREASRVLTAADKGELRRILETFTGDALTDSETFFHADRSFHQFFIQRAGNTWLTNFLETLADFLRVVRQPLFRKVDTSQTVVEHLQIVEAVLADRIDEAERLLDAHIDRVCNDVLRLAAEQRAAAPVPPGPLKRAAIR